MITIELVAPTNQELTASIYSLGSDTALVSNIALVERINSKCIYRGTFNIIPVGNYRVIAFDGTTPVAVTSVYLTGIDGQIAITTDILTIQKVMDLDDSIVTELTDPINNAMANLTSVITEVYDRLVFQVPDGPIIIIPAPSSSNTTVAWSYCYDENGKPTAGTIIYLKLIGVDDSTKKGAYLSREFTATSNEYGVAATEIPKGNIFKFKVKAGENNSWIEFRGTNETQLELPFLINK